MTETERKGTKKREREMARANEKRGKTERALIPAEGKQHLLTRARETARDSQRREGTSDMAGHLQVRAQR